MMYQHSVFGCPRPIRRHVSASGCTCTLSTSRASRNLISSGNGAGKSSVPPICSRYSPATSPSVRPRSGPLPMVERPSGRSAISQLSPIFRPGGNSLPNTLSNSRPPQIRSLNTGADFRGYASMPGIVQRLQLQRKGCPARLCPADIPADWLCFAHAAVAPGVSAPRIADAGSHPQIGFVLHNGPPRSTVSGRRPEAELNRSTIKSYVTLYG
jgi:hypothetical protein